MINVICSTIRCELFDDNIIQIQIFFIYSKKTKSGILQNIIRQWTRENQIKIKNKSNPIRMTGKYSQSL